MTKNIRGVVSLFFVVIVWGVNWPVTKLIVGNISPLWQGCLRMSIACVALFFLQIITRQMIIPKKHDLPVILSISICHMIVCTALMGIGLQFISAGRSAVLSYTTPLWVIPGALLFLKESISPRKLFGVFIGLCGLLILFNPFAMNWKDTNSVLGNGLLLISAISWAISIIIVRKHKWRATPFQLTSWQTLIAACVLGLVAFLFEGVPNFTITPKIALLLLYSSIPATALAFWFMASINKALPASTTSLAVLATPVVGIVSSQIMLKEPFDIPLLISTFFVIVGIGIGTFPEKKRISSKQ